MGRGGEGGRTELHACLGSHRANLFVLELVMQMNKPLCTVDSIASTVHLLHFSTVLLPALLVFAC